MKRLEFAMTTKFSGNVPVIVIESHTQASRRTLKFF